MLKTYCTLVGQDFKIAFRNYFHIVVLVLALIMIIVINFAIPEKVKITPNKVFFDNTEGQFLKKHLMSKGVDKDRFLDSKEALEQYVKNTGNSIGIILEGTPDFHTVSILHQGTESKETLNLLNATIEDTIKKIKTSPSQSETYPYKLEYIYGKSHAIPFNKSMLPVFICTEVVTLGFLLISVMVFQEKQEGSIRAFRITPATTLHYILSKTTVNVCLSLFFALLLMLFTLGTNANYLSAIILIINGCIFMTLLGLAISVFFKSLQEFLFPGILIIIAAGLPLTSYLTPSFSPWYVKFIPSYYLLFNLREVLLNSGEPLYSAPLYMSPWILIIFTFFVCIWAVNKKLMKEGNK